MSVSTYYLLTYTLCVSDEFRKGADGERLDPFLVSCSGGATMCAAAAQPAAAIGEKRAPSTRGVDKSQSLWGSYARSPEFRKRLERNRKEAHADRHVSDRGALAHAAVRGFEVFVARADVD